MRTVTCTNKICTQFEVPEYFIGSPDLVVCGVCHVDCELSDSYDDPEQPVMGEP